LKELVEEHIELATEASRYYLYALSLGMENAEVHELIEVLEIMTNPKD